MLLTHSFKQPESIGGREWRRRIGRRISFGFSARRHEKTLTDLRSLNKDFRTLAGQIRRLEECRSKPRCITSHERSRDIEKFRVIQRASGLLYQALGSACTKHTEHLAHLSLQPVVNEPNSRLVRFDIGLIVGDPIWFIVESFVNESLERSHAGMCNVLEDISNSLKRRESSPPAVRNTKKARKSVRFRCPSPQLECPSLLLSDPVKLPDLCMHRNFCNQIQLYLRQSSLEATGVIGLLEETAFCKHLVYRPSPRQTLVQRRPRSLAELFTPTPKSRLAGPIPQYERLRLAKLLATAVLQFHATPWLKGLRSDDIMFFETGPDSEQAVFPRLASPYMNASVKDRNGPLSRTPSLSSRIFTPNALLFGLAVVLLELAYEAPLSRLRRPSDLEEGQVDRHTEFFVAKRLSESASSQMGLRYHEIVRKCLYCDFGRGHDLTKPALQEGFYQEVICELDTLEQKFRGLLLDS